MPSPILITGASGCVGTAAVRYLQARGFDPVGFSRSGGKPGGIESISGDVTDQEQVSDAIKKLRPSQIIHLAGLQTPDCQAMPFRGMEVNTFGTANLLRAAAEAGCEIERIVFASSAAVYGPRSAYPGQNVPADSPVLPANLYGYWKYAGEGMCQAFHRETGVSAVSLRFATTYGPGRDRGLTSAPTTALKAAALGADFEIPYNGREHYHYVDDVGAAFAIAATAPFHGCAPFNLRGATMETAEFCDRLNLAAAKLGLPAASIRISPEAEPMPFVCDLDAEATMKAFPDMPLTPIVDGIDNSLLHYRQLVSEGQLTNL